MIRASAPAGGQAPLGDRAGVKMRRGAVCCGALRFSHSHLLCQLTPMASPRFPAEAWDGGWCSEQSETPGVVEGTTAYAPLTDPARSTRPNHRHLGRVSPLPLPLEPLDISSLLCSTGKLGALAMFCLTCKDIGVHLT